VLITVEPGNPNGAESCSRGWSDAKLKDDVVSLARAVVLFDGGDAAALSAAGRLDTAKEIGHDTTYWRQSADGKWGKQS